MTKLKVGDNAPEFCVFDNLGKEISLSNYKGKKIILYFYPKDSTPGCTAEACNLKENYSELLKKGFAVIGVSADSSVSHNKFIEKYSLPFPLIPDVDKLVIGLYDIWGPKKFMGKSYDGINRTTFVIDESGKIEKIFTKVETKTHTEQILKSFE
ncbi:MAG: thioredoxin-dependent thiol peroxidase [Bacteroidota bacterium]